MTSIVQKLWNYCKVLRDDGMSYGDYPGSSPGQANNEQHTCLLFLKMADERAYISDKALNSADLNSKVLLGCSRPPYNQASLVLAGYDWPSLMKNAQVTKPGAGCS